MTDQAKRTAATVLFVVAAVLCVAAPLTWNVGEGKDPNPYNAAFGLPPDPPKKEADHLLSFILLGGAAVSAISAVILLASSAPVDHGGRADDDESGIG